MIKFLNAQYAVLHIGATADADEDICFENLLKLAKRANDNGVNLCVENLIIECIVLSFGHCLLLVLISV